MPVSATSMRTTALSELMAITTDPPDGVCATAFETRFPTARCISVLSSSAITGPSPNLVIKEMPSSAAEAS
jgi:hypothetical protein